MKSYEMINGRGKRRVICSLNAIDRFVARLLAQKLRRYMEPEFCENSFAYQEGKGVAAAVEKACQYINEGYTIVMEITVCIYYLASSKYAGKEQIGTVLKSTNII